MPKTFVCNHCGEEVASNFRLKGNQKYCGKRDCQRARRRKWQRQKIKEDEAYRQAQADCLRQWRKNRPLHVYQREYRENHPDYVQENRRKQRDRNRKRREREKFANSEKIVKMDALGSLNKTGTYLLIPYGKGLSGKIVKMGAFVVQMSLLHRVRDGMYEYERGL